MLMRVQSYTVAQGGSIRLAPMQVAGSGSLASVELRASDGEVGSPHPKNALRHMVLLGGFVRSLRHACA